MGKITKREVDLNKEVEFYHPYSNDMKALPVKVKQILNSLNGQKMTLRNSLEKIKKAAPKNPKTVVAVVISKYGIKSFILLNIKDSAGIIHSWRLIKFKPVKKEE